MNRPLVIALLALGVTGSACSVEMVGSGNLDPTPIGGGGTPMPNAEASVAAPPRAVCVSTAYKSQLLPANILFVVDRSGTMICNPATPSAICEANPTTIDQTQPTKWAVIVDSMSRALDDLAVIPNVSAGLTFFSNDDSCGAQSTPNVALGPLAAPQVSAMKSALSNTKPNGGTPLIGATVLGFQHLHEQAKAPGNRFVVLVTDGADSCIGKYGFPGDVVQDFLGTELPKALAVNIRTFVIGAPGSEAARGFLSKVAFAGGSASSPTCDHVSDAPRPGTECHLDMTHSNDFGQGLSTALRSIEDQSAMSCELGIPRPSNGAALDGNTINVDYYPTGEMTPESRVPLDRDDTKPCDAGANGWQFTPDGARIRLCGAICVAARTNTNAQLVVSVGCESRIPR